MAVEEFSQTVVPVLGMHRSGTSMLTHMLSLLGVELGEPLQPPSFDNPKGFWENRFFQALNIKILQLAGCNENGFDSRKNLQKTSRGFQRVTAGLVELADQRFRVDTNHGNPFRQRTETSVSRHRRTARIRLADNGFRDEQPA